MTTTNARQTAPHSAPPDADRPRRRWIGRLTVVLALLLAPAGEAADRRSLKKADALALFVLNCAAYGAWPDPADNPLKSGNLRIAIVGEDPMGHSLDSAINEAKAVWLKGGTVQIVKVSAPATLAGNFHIVFASDKDDIPALKEKCAGSPTLIVGEDKGFLDAGGTIEVRVVRGRLEFDLNLDHLESTRVRISSRMKIRAEWFIQDGRRKKNDLR